MEKLVAGLGCGIAFVFFTLGFCLTNSWLWGCVPGFIMAGFGLFFDDEP